MVRRQARASLGRRRRVRRERRRSPTARTGMTSDPQWSPDGRRIAFVSDRTRQGARGSRNTRHLGDRCAGGWPLKDLDSRGAGQLAPLVAGRAAIAFVGANEERAHPKVWLRRRRAARRRLAADGLDLIPTGTPLGDGRQGALFESGIKGTTHLFRIDLAAKRARRSRLASARCSGRRRQWKTARLSTRQRSDCISTTSTSRTCRARPRSSSRI